MARHLYLRKANDDLVSHCRCKAADALISSPGQMDCPWCGCGWLFSCGRCRKAFAFAEGVEVGESWEETGKRTIRALYQRGPAPGEVEEWVWFMKILLRDVQVGEMYVYLDGHVIPATDDGFTIDGWHSRHDLSFVPQVEALVKPEVYNNLLCSRDYWLSNRVERHDT